VHLDIAQMFTTSEVILNLTVTRVFNSIFI